MKYSFLVVFLLAFHWSLEGQIDPNTLGMRLSSSDEIESVAAEISYQKGLSNLNRVEMDLGWTSGTLIDLFRFAAFYHWVYPLDQGFSWYLGPGMGIGFLDYDLPLIKDEDEVFLILGGQVGLQYIFEKIPLQLSMDLRPEFFVGNTFDDFDIDLGISARYIFKN
jgi:hypothetical protein